MLNGIIENYKELRAESRPRRGHTFTSETDAEVVAHLIEEHIGAGLAAAVRAAVARLDGQLRLLRRLRRRAASSSSARATRRRSWSGVGDDEIFIASAIPAFLAHTRRDRRARGRRHRLAHAPTAPTSPTSQRRRRSSARRREVPWDDDAAEKGGYETFMLKEIHEQPAALRDTLAGRLRDDGQVDLSEVDLGDELLRRLRRVFIVACGTSYHAGLIVSLRDRAARRACRCRSTWPASSATASPVFDAEIRW